MLPSLFLGESIRRKKFSVLLSKTQSGPIMPIDTIFEGFLGSILRFIGWVLVDVILEILVKGLGYLICRPFGKVDPDGLAALVFGVVGWAILGAVGYFLLFP